jgi:moderate conductance mechanosensitive channel
VIPTLPPWRQRLAIPLAALLMMASAAGAQSPVPLVPGGSAPRPAPAREEAPALSAEQLQSLIGTLEDPARRHELIATLRALQAAQAEQHASESSLPGDVLTTLVGEVSLRTEVLRKVAASIVDSLDQIPALMMWLESQARDPPQRSLWLDVGLRVAVSFALAVLAYLGVAAALRPARQSLTRGGDGSVFDRLCHLLAALVIELVPVLAFAVAVFVILAVVKPSAETRAVALPLIQAVIGARAGIAVARMIFVPTAPALRLVPLTDAAAAYGFQWTRRLISITIYGYFALAAGRQLGLPWTIYGFLLHVLFFTIVLMLMAIIVQCREPVAEAIARLADEPHNAVIRRLPGQGLARVWHLLALFYVLFVYVVWALKIPGGFELLLGATLGSALIVIGTRLLLRMVERLFGRDPRIGEEVEAVPRGIERRFHRYLPIIGGLLRALVLFCAAAALLDVWGLGTLRWLVSDAGHELGGRLMIVAVVVVVTIVVWELISLVIERTVTDTDAEGNLRLSNRARTLLNITRSFLLVFLSLIALFLILSELGLDITPLLAGAGVIGLAIGFGSQKLVQDIINGMFVLLGDTIRVGDVVEVASRTGVVEEMTMRTVVLREYSGNVHTIPYNSIDTVTNYTKDFSYAVFDIGVAYRESVDQVMEVLRQIGAEMNRDPHFRRLILEPLEVAGVDKFADSAVVIRARLKTRPLKQWEVGREFNRRVKNRFDELGIEIPFPHQTIYFGVDKEGNAPAVSVRAARDPGVEPAAEPAREPPARSAPEPVPEPVLKTDAPKPEPIVARSHGD